jgi:hypothetical protein
VTLVAPYERSFAVYFHESGVVDGQGVTYVDDGKKPAEN